MRTRQAREASRAASPPLHAVSLTCLNRLCLHGHEQILVTMSWLHKLAHTSTATECRPCVWPTRCCAGLGFLPAPPRWAAAPGGGPSPSGPRRMQPPGRVLSPQPGPWLSEARPRCAPAAFAGSRSPCVPAARPPPQSHGRHALSPSSPSRFIALPVDVPKDLCCLRPVRMPSVVCLSVSSMRS